MPNGRLNGWKEIALHLGKGVRTVQRWEKELGLPVHRVQSKAAEIIYAEIAELERWLQSRERPLPEELPEDRPAARPRQWRWAWALALAAMTAILAWAVWPRPSIPYRWEVRNNSLIVFDNQNRLLWQHVFAVRLKEEVYRDGGYQNPPIAAIEDLDGDGRPEVLFTLVPGEGPNQSFYCFNHDSSIRFEQAAIASKRFGDKTYFGPFQGLTFHVTAEADGRKTLWLARIHHKEFPSVLQKLGPDGRILAEYWSSGHIHELEEGVALGRRVMFAGGISNEHDLAGQLAILDYKDPSGSAPSLKEYYRCRDCPQGTPLAYLIFPRMEVSYATAGATGAKEIKVEADGSSRIEVYQGAPLSPGGSTGPTVFYFLDSRFQVLKGELSSNFAETLRLAAQQGRFNRKLTKNPQTELFPVLVWDGEKYVPHWPPTLPHQARR